MCIKSSINFIFSIRTFLLHTVSGIKEHVVNRVRAGRSGFRISAGSKKCFFSPNRLDCNYGPQNFPFCGYRGSFKGESGRSVMLTKWRYSSTPPQDVTAWTGEILHFTANITFRISFMLQNTVELHLSGRWLSGSPIIRIGLALRVNLSRIL